ncbi:MAG: hypothetical protein EZS28_053280, partial [Streblomastix strix]
IREGGKITISESTVFQNCQSISGNGGGIYIDIDLIIGSYIKILQAQFAQCQSYNTTIPNQRAGYGSGIFMIINNWANELDGIDLRGAEYINCFADQGDKGLFIVMSDLQYLCRLGDPKGQYIRSIGYQDEISDMDILKGYLGQPSDFESSSNTDEYLSLQVSPLEPFWSQLGNRWYISSVNEGQNIIACGQKDHPCKTITYTLDRLPSDYTLYDPTTENVNMILLENDLLETEINVNAGTILGQDVAIKSLGGGKGLSAPQNLYK